MRPPLVECNMMQHTRKRVTEISVSYILEGTVLENVEKIKYLGITVNTDLKWNIRQQYLSIGKCDLLLL